MQNVSQSKNNFGDNYILTLSGTVEKAALTRQFLNGEKMESEALGVEIEGLKLEVERPDCEKVHGK